MFRGGNIFSSLNNNEYFLKKSVALKLPFLSCCHFLMKSLILSCLLPIRCDTVCMLRVLSSPVWALLLSILTGHQWVFWGRLIREGSFLRSLRLAARVVGRAAASLCRALNKKSSLLWEAALQEQGLVIRWYLPLGRACTKACGWRVEQELDFRPMSPSPRCSGQG